MQSVSNSNFSLEICKKSELDECHASLSDPTSMIIMMIDVILNSFKNTYDNLNALFV